MSFDAHSRERLAALGRSLPQPLPTPEPPQRPESTAAGKRHRVEVEENPEELFRELMQVSPDGTVPPHLLERLRELEARRQAPDPAPTTPAPGSPSRAKPRKRTAAPGRPDQRDLYTAFQQLLLEDEDDS